MSNLTILVPLKDRHEFTNEFLKENILENYEYFFADGSKNDFNEKIFSKINKKNITYKRFTEDLSCKDMIRKIYNSTKFIKSKFIMLADNDDFLNYKGLDSCLNLLSKNKEINIIGSNISFIKKKKLSNKYEIVYNFTNCKYLNKTKSKISIFKMFNPYNYVHYSIFKMDVFRKVFDDLCKFEINHFQLFEIFHSQLSLMYSVYYHKNTNHYIRLENKKYSNDNNITNNFESLKNMYYSNNIMQNQIDNIYNYISDYSNCKKEDLKYTFEQYLNSKKKPIKKYILKKIFIKILYLFVPKLKLNNIRKIYINYFKLFT